jgi:hypothetical protein
MLKYTKLRLKEYAALLGLEGLSLLVCVNSCMP